MGTPRATGARLRRYRAADERTRVLAGQHSLYTGAKAALGFAEKAVQRLPFDDSAAAELRRHFTAREIVELAMVVGFYVSTAIFVKALAVPAETA